MGLSEVRESLQSIGKINSGARLGLNSHCLCDFGQVKLCASVSSYTYNRDHSTAYKIGSKQSTQKRACTLEATGNTSCAQ